jgi:hypothetical protein
VLDSARPLLIQKLRDRGIDRRVLGSGLPANTTGPVGTVRAFVVIGGVAESPAQLAMN